MVTIYSISGLGGGMRSTYLGSLTVVLRTRSTSLNLGLHNQYHISNVLEMLFPEDVRPTAL